ncbi:MAG: bis-aminopropyl spermidine synthase family protein, partial [Spirochaetales bacterium]|nr:bis-aminopropyl spermidine synthase family protein [Spirochaetales bacterium]
MTRKSFQIALRLSRGPASVWELIEAADGTIVETYETCRELLDRGEAAFTEGRFLLTESGRSSYGRYLRQGFEDVLARYRQTIEGVPGARVEYFQQRITPEDLFRRLEFMYRRGDLAGRRFFILGDDDYLSIALALTGLPERITVVEIDTRITDFIQAKARALSLPIEVAEYNAADPLPKELAGQFDTFVTDPVETSKGFTATIARGVASLRHPGAAYFGLTELECPPARWHAFQKMFNESGLVVTDILRDHTHYVDNLEDDPTTFKLYKEAPFPIEGAVPDFRWYRSSFFRLITVDTPR